MTEFRFLASQAMAIASGLQSDEDRLFWTASTSLAVMIQQQPELFAPLYPKFLEYQNEFFAQACQGTVVLSTEFKAFVQYWVNVAYSPDALERQREVFEALCDMLEDQ